MICSFVLLYWSLLVLSFFAFGIKHFKTFTLAAPIKHGNEIDVLVCTGLCFGGQSSENLGVQVTLSCV